MVYRTSLTGPVFGLRREIDRLFEDTFGRDTGRAGWSPAVDVREDNNEIALEIELPGIRPADVEVTAENGVLTIRGEKQNTTTESSEGRYHVVERSYGSFARSFQLPQGVDETRIEAEFTDGLLTVHVPKAALPQPRRIEIRNSGSQPVVQGAGARSAGRPSGSEAAGHESPSALGATSRTATEREAGNRPTGQRTTSDSSPPTSEGSASRTNTRTTK
jgi:HSP20 family protein